MAEDNMVTQLQEAVTALHGYGDQMTAEAAKYGEASAATKTALEKANTRIDELETKLNRPATTDVVAKAEPSEARAAFGAYLRKGFAGLGPEERHALVEDANGQILVPEEIEVALTTALPALTIIRGLATTLATKSDRIRRNSLADPTVGWGSLETGTVVADTMPSVPTEAYMYVEDLYGLAKIGEDELDDSSYNLEQWLNSAYPRVVGKAEDDAFVAGTGHANQQPEGILNGTVVTRVTAGQTGAITTDDIVSLIYAVPAQYRRAAVLIVASSTEKAMRLLKDTNGQYLWRPSLIAKAPSTFDGYVVMNQESVPAIPAAAVLGDVAIFGDIRIGYQIRDRKGITIQRLNELYSTSGMVGFKLRTRVAGGVTKPDALRVLSVPVA